MGDAKYIAERKKQLIAYFNTLHRYPDVLLSQAVHQLVIPPVLVQKYSNITTECVHPSPAISESDKEKSEENIFASTQPVLPSQSVLKPPSKENSPDVSLPIVFGADMAYFDDDEDEYINASYSRPRRGSYPGCDAPNKYLTPPALNGDFARKPRPKLSIFTDEEKKDGMVPIDDAIKLDEDSDDLDDEKHKKVQNIDAETKVPMERF